MKKRSRLWLLISPLIALVASIGFSHATATRAPMIGAAPAPFDTKQVYDSKCASCHGAHLEGVSAPALTGASFASAHLNLAQIRTVVTTQMPLTAPGSLKPEQYADIMAFLLSYDCVKASPGNAAFPTSACAARNANGSAPGKPRDSLPTTTSRWSGGATSAPATLS